jgi:hypothetical protein
MGIFPFLLQVTHVIKWLINIRGSIYIENSLYCACQNFFKV